MVTLRPIARKDQQALALLIRSVFEEHGAPKVNTVYDDPRTFHIYEHAQREGAAYWVVDDGGTVCGGCGYYPTEGLPEGWAEVVKLYLAPQVRGLGLGSRLFRLVTSEARKAGYRHLYLESFSQFSDAVAMYLRHGFRPLPVPMGQSGHTATDIHMALDLL